MFRNLLQGFDTSMTASAPFDCIFAMITSFEKLSNMRYIFPATSLAFVVGVDVTGSVIR